LYFGTKRSPIHSMATLTQFLEQVQQFKNIKVVGCMAYDAQIAGVADQTDTFFGLKSKLIQSLKRDAFPKVTRLRQQLVAHVKHFYNLQFVNAGGTGSMALLKSARDVTEITVGSAFFAPALFSQYEALQLQPAAGFALTITRKFSDDIFVCHGGGYVASGAVGKDKQPQFLEPDVYELTSLEGAGEVQTPILVKGRQHDIGDTIYLRHAKAGELCERFKQLHATRNGEYIGEISTYRGDGQCFL
ncbi:MAG: amino acid deaminase/aldolase, partial [Lysinibacillus sp.]